MGEDCVWDTGCEDIYRQPAAHAVTINAPHNEGLMSPMRWRASLQSGADWCPPHRSPCRRRGGEHAAQSWFYSNACGALRAQDRRGKLVQQSKRPPCR